MQIKKCQWRMVGEGILACSSLKGRISDTQVIEDFESRPHKAVSFIVERGKERQEWNKQKLWKALPGHSGGRLPGRCTEEKGREKEEECAKRRQGQAKNEKIEEGIRNSQRMAFRRLRMKKKKKKDRKKATKWQNNGERSNIWMT